VIGKAADVAKTTGKVILQKDGALFLNPNSKKKKQIYYPTLSKAKRTTPTLVLEKETKAQISSEATLLRAMETAGKQVDDEDLRELMKENGGRPSTRANIIETLFKRQYIVRNKNRCYRRLGSVDWYHSK
jgi:DNA topoisomerase-3